MSGSVRIDFLLNVAASTGLGKFWLGGKMALFAEAGTFTSGSVKLQFQTPQGTWVDVLGAVLSQNGMVVMDLPAGQYRAVATGGSLAGVYVQGVLIPR